MTRRRVVWIVAAVVALAVTWALWPSSEQPFYDYLDERRAAGLPTTRDELLGPMPPDAENGAFDLEAGCRALEKDFGSYLIDSRGAGAPETLAPERRSELAAAAERMRPGIEPLVRAADKPHLRFPVAFDDDGWRVRPEHEVLFKIRIAITIAASGEPDPVRRLAACRALLLVANRLEPRSWLDAMVAISMEPMGLTALRDAVESGTVVAADARTACDALLRRSRADAIRHASAGEAVELAEAYRALIEGRATPRSAKPSLWGRLKERWQRATSGPLVPATPIELEAGIATRVVGACRACDAVASLRDLRSLATAEVIASVERSGALSGMAGLVLLQGLVQQVERSDAAARLARVALAAAEFRAAHGDYPDSLDDLAPMFPDGVPLDPYTDAPFVYGHSEDEVRVRSRSAARYHADVDDAKLREWCLFWRLKR